MNFKVVENEEHGRDSVPRIESHAAYGEYKPNNFVIIDWNQNYKNYFKRITDGDIIKVKKIMVN